LVERVPAFHNNVVDDGGKPAVADQRNPERIGLFTTMSAVAKRNKIIGLERIENASDRIFGVAGIVIRFSPRLSADIMSLATYALHEKYLAFHILKS
jgi:hypothetical protein